MKLRFRADLRSLACVGSYFVLVIWQWFAAPGSIGGQALLIAATCVFSFLGAVVTHNAVHCPVFVSRAANRIYQVVLSLTYGSPVSSYVPGHNLSHHKHMQSEKDVMRTTKVRHRYNLLNLLEFVPRVGFAIARNDAVYTSAMKRHHRAWYRQFRIEQVAVFGLTFALLLIDWKKALLYWLLPHAYAAWGIIGMNYLQHDGCDSEHTYNHSRNFVGGVINWITFNNGYHGAHHMMPGLHWSLLPAMHAEKLAPFIDPRLDQRSFLAYLFRTFFWPGHRVRFDGSPLELPALTGDTNWIPKPEETPADLGAIGV